MNIFEQKHSYDKSEYFFFFTCSFSPAQTIQIKQYTFILTGIYFAIKINEELPQN